MQKQECQRLFIILCVTAFFFVSCRPEPPINNNNTGTKIKSIVYSGLFNDDPVRFNYNSDGKISLIKYGGTDSTPGTRSIRVYYDASGKLERCVTVFQSSEYVNKQPVFYEYRNNKIINIYTKNVISSRIDSVTQYEQSLGNVAADIQDTINLEYDAQSRITIVNYKYPLNINTHPRSDTIQYASNSSNVVNVITSSYLFPGFSTYRDKIEVIEREYDLSIDNPFYTLNDLFFILLVHPTLGEYHGFKSIPSSNAESSNLQPYLFLSPNWPQAIYATFIGVSSFSNSRFQILITLNSSGKVQDLECQFNSMGDHITFNYY